MPTIASIFIWCAVSHWWVSSTSLPLVTFRTSHVCCENLSGVINNFWHDSLDTLTLFHLSFIVNTLSLWIISYWCIYVFWHCLCVFNVWKKWKLRTKGRLKFQFHAGSIAIFSFMHKIPNKANSLQPCACNAPLAYIYIYIYVCLSTQSLYVCLSVCLSV